MQVMSGCRLTTHKIRYSQWKITSILLSDKRMNICILVVHDLTNDMSYNAKLNRSTICYFGVK